MNSALLLSIAMQCPYMGGPAVYHARTLLSMLTNTIQYNDGEICALNGIYRGSNQESGNNENWIQIVPNPANQKILIKLKGKLEGICQLVVSDASGRQVSTLTFESSQNEYELNIVNLVPGVYQVMVKVNDEKLFNSKLVISR